MEVEAVNYGRERGGWRLGELGEKLTARRGVGEVDTCVDMSRWSAVGWKGRGRPMARVKERGTGVGK